jgi:uncharacterized membrane protein
MQRRKQPLKSLVFICFVFLFIWVVLQFLAPFVLPRGSVTDLSGVVGLSDNEDLIQNMSFPWNVMYLSGDRLCHQKADRSLFLNGNEMPFCARCTAIWFGLAVGLGYMVLFLIELNQRFLIALVGALLPIGVDGIGQLLGFWESTNLVRILTGFPIGMVCGVAIGIIFDELHSMRIFHHLSTFLRNSRKKD